jgi:hypothetical protein
MSIERIKREIAIARQGGLTELVKLGEIELRRRKSLANNAGRPIVNDTAKHASWREASARYRAKRQAEQAESKEYENMDYS